MGAPTPSTRAKVRPASVSFTARGVDREKRRCEREILHQRFWSVCVDSCTEALRGKSIRRMIDGQRECVCVGEWGKTALFAPAVAAAVQDIIGRKETMGHVSSSSSSSSSRVVSIHRCFFLQRRGNERGGRNSGKGKGRGGPMAIKKRIFVFGVVVDADSHSMV